MQALQPTYFEKRFLGYFDLDPLRTITDDP